MRRPATTVSDSTSIDAPRAARCGARAARGGRDPAETRRSTWTSSRARSSAGIARGSSSSAPRPCPRGWSRASRNGSRVACSREPCAYIVGVSEFWGLDFRVTPGGPDPPAGNRVHRRGGAAADARWTPPEPARPDPAHRRYRHRQRLHRRVARPRIPDCHIVATDVSAEALDGRARERRRVTASPTAFEFVATSYLDGIDGDFDMIVANPPYVPRRRQARRWRPTCGTSRMSRSSAGATDCATSKACSTPPSHGSGRAAGLSWSSGSDRRTTSCSARVSRRPALRVDAIRADLQGIPRRSCNAIP